MFCMICFDIVDDRDRYRVVKALKSHGVRVQKSVFECPNLTEERFLKLKSRLEDQIDHEQDSVRYYFLCRSCIGKVELSGIGDLPETSEFQVV